MCAHTQVSLQDKNLYKTFLLQKDYLASSYLVKFLKREETSIYDPHQIFLFPNASSEREGIQGSSVQK